MYKVKCWFICTDWTCASKLPPALQCSCPCAFGLQVDALPALNKNGQWTRSTWASLKHTGLVTTTTLDSNSVRPPCASPNQHFTLLRTYQNAPDQLQIPWQHPDALRALAAVLDCSLIPGERLLALGEWVCVPPTAKRCNGLAACPGHARRDGDICIATSPACILYLQCISCQSAFHITTLKARRGAASLLLMLAHMQHTHRKAPSSIQPCLVQKCDP